MQRLAELFRLFVPLAAAVYLGFYAFAVVMGVFNPIDSWGFTAIAAICILGLVAYLIARRRGHDPVQASSPTMRDVHAQRERRGF